MIHFKPAGDKPSCDSLIPPPEKSEIDPLRQGAVIQGPHRPGELGVFHFDPDPPPPPDLKDSRIAPALEPLKLDGGRIANLMGSGVLLQYTGPTGDELRRMLESGDSQMQLHALWQLYDAFSSVRRAPLKAEHLCRMIFGEKFPPAWLCVRLERLEETGAEDVQEEARRVRHVLPPLLPRST